MPPLVEKCGKIDANTEAFQMRSQWKKAEMCRQLWYEKWSWLLDERKPMSRAKGSDEEEDSGRRLRQKRALRQAISIGLETVALEEAEALRQSANLRQVHAKHDFTKTLKPVPLTSNGFVGWIAGRPDCQLEIYTSWLAKPPLRLPDAWDDPNYVEKKK